MGEVEVTRVPINLIDANPANYKYHPPEQIKDLKASLSRFGQVEPAVVKRRQERYLLVAHEGVTTAAQELWISDPVAFASLYQYLVVIVPEHWTDVDVRGYMVASNELTRLGIAQDDKLYALLTEQREQAYDLHTIGSSDEGYHMLTDLLAENTSWSELAVEKPQPSHSVPEEKPPQQLPLEEQQRAPILNFRQLVLVMDSEAYEDMVMFFAVLRERLGLGSHADIVAHLIAFYKEYHPELLAKVD